MKYEENIWVPFKVFTLLAVSVMWNLQVFIIVDCDNQDPWSKKWLSHKQNKTNFTVLLLFDWNSTNGVC